MDTSITSLHFDHPVAVAWRAVQDAEGKLADARIAHYADPAVRALAADALAKLASPAATAGAAQRELSEQVKAASAASWTISGAVGPLAEKLAAPSLTELRARARELLADAMQHVGDTEYVHNAVTLADAVARLPMTADETDKVAAEIDRVLQKSREGKRY